jgi:hypothetical protein
MPAPTKVNNIIALLGKDELTYGGGGTLNAAVDTLPLHVDDPRQGIGMTRTPLFDGDLGPDPMSLAPSRGAPPSGFKGEISPSFRFGGPGVAFSASVFSTLHKYLKWCGYQATLTSTVSAEKWEYIPEVDPWNAWNRDTAFLRALRAGEQWDLTAAMGSLSVTGEGNTPWKFVAKMVAQSAEPVDAAFPAVSLPNYVYPLGSDTTISIGNYGTGRVHSFSFDDNHDLATDRDAMNAAGGYDGAVPGRRMPKVKINVEATAFVGAPFHTSSGLNPYRLHANATVIPVALQNGSEQYARVKLLMDYAQVISVVPSTKGAQPLWEIEVKPTPSAPGANDYLRWVTD